MPEDLSMVLEYKSVTFRLATGSSSGPLSATAAAGAVVALVANGHDAACLFDISEGLVTPESGNVLFAGRDWRDAGPSEENRMRAEIGRVFRGKAWISNLSVLENITLARVFHSGVDVDRDLHVAMQDAGVDSIPSCRPHELNESDSMVCQWLRAFLGPRRLVLLEEPVAGVPEDRLEGLARLMRRCVERGGAIVVTGHGESVLKHLSPVPARVMSMLNGQWVDGGGG